MAMTLSFHVQTPDGVVRPVEFPTDQPVGVLLRELVTDDSLRIQPPKPEDWHLHHEIGDQKLDLGKNLEQNGVGRGERLQLRKAHEEKHDIEEPPQPKGEMKRCDNGHYYDPKKHAAGCPYCGAAIEIPGPRSVRIGPPAGGPAEDMRTRPQGMKIGPTSPGVSRRLARKRSRPRCSVTQGPQ